MIREGSNTFFSMQNNALQRNVESGLECGVGVKSILVFQCIEHGKKQGEREGWCSFGVEVRK